MCERKKLANNLHRLRKEKGLTQEELAKQLGYSIGGYQKIEWGHRNMNIQKAIKATQILGCSLDDIFLPKNMPNCASKGDE